ncbi:unnamed protein product [Prunus armeniaca]
MMGKRCWLSSILGNLHDHERVMKEYQAMKEEIKARALKEDWDLLIKDYNVCIVFLPVLSNCRQLREKWVVFNRGEGDDLQQGKSLQKTKYEKQSSSFKHRCDASQRLSDA